MFRSVQIALVAVLIASIALSRESPAIQEVQRAYQRCITIAKRPHQKIVYSRELSGGKSGAWVRNKSIDSSGENLTLWLERGQIVYATLIGGEDYYLADRWCFRSGGSIAFLHSSRGLPVGFRGEARWYFDAFGCVIRRLETSTDPNGVKRSSLGLLAAPRVFKKARALLKGLGVTP
jgi:hypothetical protein